MLVLDRVVAPLAAAPGLAGPDHPSRALVERFSRGDATAGHELQAEYDRQATDWLHWTDTQPDYLAPLYDALERGVQAVPATGTIVEVGAGAGPATNVLQRLFGTVIAVDISFRMLTRARDVPCRVQADVRTLPFSSGEVDLLVGLNAVPDWTEIARVLSPNGQLLWASSFGDETPLYFPPSQVADALARRPCVTACAGHGDWVVALGEGIER